MKNYTWIAQLENGDFIREVDEDGNQNKISGKFFESSITIHLIPLEENLPPHVIHVPSGSSVVLTEIEYTKIPSMNKSEVMLIGWCDGNLNDKINGDQIHNCAKENCCNPSYIYIIPSGLAHFCVQYSCIDVAEII